jgi:hypothetical protein
MTNHQVGPRRSQAEPFHLLGESGRQETEGEGHAALIPAGEFESHQEKPAFILLNEILKGLTFGYG